MTGEAELGKTGRASAVCVGDYDNDGALDLFLTDYGRNVLYPNRGRCWPTARECGRSSPSCRGGCSGIAASCTDLTVACALCIGCGACVAACPNASAMLFTGAKVSQMALLPQGQPERYLRVRKMVAAMDEAGFGGCTNHGECEAACPKGITLDVIARMNRDYLKACLTGAEESKGGGGAG